MSWLVLDFPEYRRLSEVAGSDSLGAVASATSDRAMHHFQAVRRGANGQIVAATGGVGGVETVDAAKRNCGVISSISKHQGSFCLLSKSLRSGLVERGDPKLVRFTGKRTAVPSPMFMVVGHHLCRDRTRQSDIGILGEAAVSRVLVNLEAGR